jgi:hypothetical protein
MLARFRPGATHATYDDDNFESCQCSAHEWLDDRVGVHPWPILRLFMRVLCSWATH